MLSLRSNSKNSIPFNSFLVEETTLFGYLDILATCQYKTKLPFVELVSFNV